MLAMQLANFQHFIVSKCFFFCSMKVQSQRQTHLCCESQGESNKFDLSSGSHVSKQGLLRLYFIASSFYSHVGHIRECAPLLGQRPCDHAAEQKSAASDKQCQRGSGYSKGCLGLVHQNPIPRTLNWFRLQLPLHLNVKRPLPKNKTRVLPIQRA